MKSLLACLLVGVAGLVGLACSSDPGDESDPDQSEADLTETAPDDNAPLVVKDPRTLMELEKRGLSFEKLLNVTGPSGKDLLASRKYKGIVDAIEGDLAALRIEDPASGVGFDFLHRQFDPKWLRSPQSRFELIGVVNRLDRMTTTSCGDFRLIYRFAYTAKRSEGRLPMTVSLVFPQKNDGEGCSTVAERWMTAKSGSADALLAGPLKDRAQMEWIDINVQAVRWPSNARREFGGESEYILRTFWVRGDAVGPQLLENTPRTDLGEEERAALRTWIRENVDAIDQGTAIVPTQFLAKQARSVGPSGLARLANRPFSQNFAEPEKAFGDLPLDKTKQIGSVAALMRRLDTMSCQGCHQARSIAGFHLLGDERDSAARLNALATGRSPHFTDELAWRGEHLQAIAAKKPFTTVRPFAEHGAAGGQLGAHCGLGDAGFRGWTCAAGLECLDHHGEVVGTCSPTNAPIGDSCETGKITLVSDPHQDTVTDRKTSSCDQAGRNARCNAVSLGFPDGLCRTDCSEAEAGTVVGDTICGGIPSASGLTKCLTVLRLPFAECLAANNNPTFLRTCDATSPCRDDYACMRVNKGPASVGACMPPYFAFQARVDGHMFDE